MSSSTVIKSPAKLAFLYKSLVLRQIFEIWHMTDATRFIVVRNQDTDTQTWDSETEICGQWSAACDDACKYFYLMLVLIKESNHEISLISTIHNKSVMWAVASCSQYNHWRALCTPQLYSRLSSHCYTNPVMPVL